MHRTNVLLACVLSFVFCADAFIRRPHQFTGVAQVTAEHLCYKVGNERDCIDCVNIAVVNTNNYNQAAGEIIEKCHDKLHTAYRACKIEKNTIECLKRTYNTISVPKHETDYYNRRYMGNGLGEY